MPPKVISKGVAKLPNEMRQISCAVCSKVEADQREFFRSELIAVPVNEDVCDCCLMAFFRNIGFPVTQSEESSDNQTP